MRKIATAAALFTAIGSGAALAQGAPPGSPSWQSGWPSYVEAHQPKAMTAHKATTARPDRLTATNPVPVARNSQNGVSQSGVRGG